MRGAFDLSCGAHNYSSRAAEAGQEDQEFKLIPGYTETLFNREREGGEEGGKGEEEKEVKICPTEHMLYTWKMFPCTPPPPTPVIHSLQ